MNKSARLGLVAIFLLTIAGLAWAKGPSGVTSTIHNLATSNPLFHTYTADNVDEVCVFCHTPHGGSLAGPLWNHDLPTGTFTHYTSTNLSGYLQGLALNRPVNEESLLCMSCHDGSVAVDHLINDPNSLAGQPITIFFGQQNMTMMTFFGAAGPRIGESAASPGGSGDLSDDHPISFSYQSVINDPKYMVGGPNEDDLRHIGNVGDPTSVLGYNGEGIRLFGPDFRVECSSCHDPHVNYEGSLGGNEAYRPFLIRPNAGSELCLSCHNK
ncbi:MAG: cytochrome c3 family protein [Desulfuromonadales bacterium]|nr:cytochrome c3 family protein [Desulfuromonadales bacterium]